VPHLLALAPLDVWLRLLITARRVHPSYWPRLAFCLFTSWIGTVLTMPERLLLAPVLFTRFRRDTRLDHPAGVVIILGYYRTGTTHLHNLLASDARVNTPRWSQCLAGQGWLLSWTLMRFILTPFLGNTRPQDGVGFGPDWPAEDDFALATWAGASSLPGRFIFPSRWETFARWHDLRGLTPAELARWRRATAAFCWKITRLRPSDPLILKTPSHTARVAELDRLFKGSVRFVHITRDPAAVLASNLKMHAALAPHALEDLPDQAVLAARIGAEYQSSEAKCQAELAALDPSRVVRVRYEDLIADPMAELARIRPALGLPADQPAEDAAAAYLHRVGRYRGDSPAPNLPPDPEPQSAVRRPVLAVGVGLLTASAAATLWLTLVWTTHHFWGWQQRFDFLVWLTGGMVGTFMARSARIGSPRLGWLAAGVTLLVFAALSFPITVFNWNWAADSGWRLFLYHNGRGALHGVLSTSSLVFATLGALSAWRQASRTTPRAPGT
jgi:hypothetical protein